MCGLFGIANFDSLNKEHAIKALNVLSHRGPDQHDYRFSNDVFIGHQRLSILDLSPDGQQPMQYQDVIITVNGEIYNFKELKCILSEKYQFKSGSDSEVVLFGYIEWGIRGLLERIDGMYSIVIYDKRINNLFLARDRVGIKPLYYSLFDQELTWGSELKAIEAYYDKGTLEIDNTSLYDFLTYLYVPAPKTLYKNVFKLEAAHFAVFDLDTSKLEITKYWDLNTKVKEISLTEAKNKLRLLIEKSVDEQMISDVPVGFFLSGGVDSSVVVATAAKVCSEHLHTYTIGFDDKSHDETEYAGEVAKLFNTDHKKKILDSNEAKRIFSKIIEWYDEPFADTSAFPTYLVSTFAKKESTVVLTGDGGDEVFGGYQWYEKFSTSQKSIVRKMFQPLKYTISVLKNNLGKGFIYKLLSRFERDFVLTDFELYTSLMGGLLENEKREYAKNLNIPDDYDDYWHFKRFYRKDLPMMTRLQYMDFHTYLPDDILTKVDRVSMAVSLECRVPLLSKELIEFSFSLPESIRYTNGHLKGILKESFVGILPDGILYRQKKGFSIPGRSWKNALFSGFRTKQEYILDLFVKAKFKNDK